MPSLSPILLLSTPEDIAYLVQFKTMLKGRPCLVIDSNPDSAADIDFFCKSKGIKYVISTNSTVLNKVVGGFIHQTLDNWNGSIYERSGITYLFLNPLRQFYTVPYGRFTAERFLSKIISPRTWSLTPTFHWELAKAETIENWYESFRGTLAIAIDIETLNHYYKNEKDIVINIDTIIRCVCFTGLWPDGKIFTLVIPIYEAAFHEQEFFLIWLRKFCALPQPKVMQNGLYDNGHLITYHCPVTNYLFDTQSLFHALYSELPKRLDFIAAFCVHNIYFWKDLAKEQSKLFEYNAMDGWATMLTFLYLIKEMPDWAIQNYLMKFPLFAPCCYCNLEGFKVNEDTRQKLTNEYKTKIETSLSRLRLWFGQDFNPRSPTQVTKLIQFYGSRDITNSDKHAVAKFALRHPLNARFAGEITTARESAKIITTYLKPADYTPPIGKVDAKKKLNPLLKYGRLFYALNPDGTDTGRLACKEGIYWCGSQIQNQPEEVREMYIPDDGFEIFELDNKTSESYCTAYLSGDANLLDTINSGKDFHSLNASKFFGLKYEEIYDDNTGKVINKPIRQTSKRTNHGANYNMQWFMLIQTMGEKAIDESKKLLCLPNHWTRRMVAEHLLDIFDKTYPTLRNIKNPKSWYYAIATRIALTHKLVSQLGWTRYCFGKPFDNREDLNGYVAHESQNLSVGIINEGFKKVFWKVMVPNYQNFRLKAQIHDSILGQNRIGYRHLVEEARQICILPTMVTDAHNVKRLMTIPVEAKIGMDWGHLEKFA